MRLFLTATFAGIALALAAPASAAPVTLRPVTIDAKLQKKFDDDYGQREVPILQRIVVEALTRELSDAGATVADGAPVTIETTLVDVKPSKPTFQQATDKIGLDVFRSSSIGGAKLRARIVGADGATLGEVAYDWYESDLQFSTANTTWSDARLAIRRFADKVGDAYRANSGS
jgi:hypothetical protein